MRGAARKQLNWWALLFLPIFLRALIPIGFMPVVGPHFSVQLMVCDGDGPMTVASSTATAPMAMSMDMPAGMVMDDAAGPAGLDHHLGHEDRGTCSYGAAPGLGGIPTLAILPSHLIQQTLEASLATAQVASAEVAPRAQSPRAPPV